MFGKHRKSIDYMLLALASVQNGDYSEAAEHLKSVKDSDDLNVAMQELNNANEEAFSKQYGHKESTNDSKGSLTSALRKALAGAEDNEDSEFEEESSDDEEFDDEENMGDFEEEEPEVLEDARVTARLARAERNLKRVAK